MVLNIISDHNIMRLDINHRGKTVKNNKNMEAKWHASK